MSIETPNNMSEPLPQPQPRERRPTRCMPPAVPLSALFTGPSQPREPDDAVSPASQIPGRDGVLVHPSAAPGDASGPDADEYSPTLSQPPDSSSRHQRRRRRGLEDNDADREAFLDLREQLEALLLDCIELVSDRNVHEDFGLEDGDRSVEDDDGGDDGDGQVDPAREEVGQVLRASLQRIALQMTGRVSEEEEEESSSRPEDDCGAVMPWSVVIWLAMWDLAEHFGIPPELYECLEAAATTREVPSVPICSPFVGGRSLDDLTTRSRDLVADLPALAQWEYVRMTAVNEMLTVLDGDDNYDGDAAGSKRK